MSRKSFWKDFFSAAHEVEAEAEAEETPLPATGQTQTLDVVAAMPAIDAAQTAELARVRAELAKERSARVQDNAAAWADAEITGLRAMPAERETLIEAYVQAAMDDNAFGASTAIAGPSRVDALKARQTARPAHLLTQESLPVLDGTKAAVNRDATPRADAEKPATPDDIARLLKMTPDGQRALASKKN